MSLFPAYNASAGEQEKNEGIDIVQENDAVPQMPAWLTNTSFKDFQETINKTQPIEVLSSSSEAGNDQVIEIASDSSGSDSRRKGKRTKKKRKNRSSSITSDSSDDFISRARRRRRARSSSSSDSSRSRSRSRERRDRRRNSRSKERESKRRSRSRKRESRKRRSRSRKRKSRSRSRDRRKRSKSRSREKHSKNRSRDEIIANSKHSSKKNFIEEVGVGLANAFREDRTGDKTNLTGMSWKEVAKYKCKLRVPLGSQAKRRMIAAVLKNPRFHSKAYLKKLLKTKRVRRITKDRVKRSSDELKADFVKPYLDLTCHTSVVKVELEDEDMSRYNPLGIYDKTTEDWVKGVGGLQGEEEEIFENDEMQSRRLEYNRRLRNNPTNVELWIEFIDFQDQALEQTVFRAEGDEGASAKTKKARGEILRAKALTERKLAICKSAIERNTRSVKLAVKRLELSRDLFDSKTLDQQWKELIFVYPENISLWKRYLLFVQTHYIRFSIPDTCAAYKGCIVKLRTLLEQKVEAKEEGSSVFELEQGILDIVEQGALLLLQSGHSEKAVAIYQGMLELNLFSPSFPGPGYTVADKLSLLEPIWDSGVARVGEVGARGWGEELQDRIAQGNREVEVGGPGSEEWEGSVLAQDKAAGAVWLQLEVGREKEQFFPWRQGEAEPEDPERIVDFDTVHEWMCEFSRPETKFRLVLSLLRLLGVEWKERFFSSLLQSAASDSYLGVPAHHGHDFHGGARLLQPIIPQVMSAEKVATFTHFIFAQIYDKFEEPYKTKLMIMWLDFEYLIVEKNPSNPGLKKDLKKLAKTLLKEDRNNVELVVQFAELETRLGGYATGQAVLETSIMAGGRVLLLQEQEEDVVAASRLYRAAAELELREIVSARECGSDPALHKDRLQWLLVQVGAQAVFTPMTEKNKTSMIGLVDKARTEFEAWLGKRMDDPRKRIKVFQQAPAIRHSGCEVLFLYTWLLYFTLGPNEALEVLAGYSERVEREVQAAEDRLSRQERRSEEMVKSGGRFDVELQTLRFVQESIDKIAFDLIWFEAAEEVGMRQKLRSFYLSCLAKYPHSGFFHSQLPVVESSTSVVSSVWREVCKVGLEKNVADSCSHGLMEQMALLGLSKVSAALADCSTQVELPALAVGLLNRLRHLLEKLTSVASVRHSPLLWRLLIWAASLLTSRLEAKDAAEELKTVLYRAIQDVPWDKALYLDTALYLDRRGQLYQTTSKEVKFGEGEDHPEDEFVEPKFEMIPGTLEHITELMVEKELRVRLPLPELEVLMEPL